MPESSIEISVVRLDPELALPAYSRPGDAGLDLFARTGAVLAAGGGRAVVPTGLAIALPAGHLAFVVPRSGLASDTASPSSTRPA
ncbi:MAG: hypothetical protein R2715_05915 [Ilumatobacteraceae bacterium]